MVHYKVALGALLTLATATQCEGLVSPPREMAARKSTSSRRHVSVSSPLDQYNNDDNDDMTNKNSMIDPTRKLLDTVETLGESLTEAILRDDEDNARHERMLELKKQRMRERLLPRGWVVNFALDRTMGLTLAQVDTACQLSSQVLDVDTLRYEPITNYSNVSTVVQGSTDVNFRGVVVLAVKENEQGWSAGIRPGDIVVASSATVGEAMWPKTTLEGVKSAIASRKVVASQLALQLHRVSSNDAQVSNQYELILPRPLGLEIDEDKEGYVVVTGFSEKASNLALKGVQIGDRIVAVGSSVGDIMWPVSTVEGVVSACTARLPGQTVTMRFQRPMENLRLGTADDECTVADEPMVVVASSTAVAPTPTKTTTMTYEQEKQLLQRCCDVLKRYWSDSKTDFVGKNDIPALVADKVVDAVASASVSFDAVTLSMVMNAYLTCNQPDNAIRVFEASTGFSADGSDDSPNIVITGKERGTLLAKTDSLNLFTASSAMHAFAMKGDSSSAMRILAALEGQGGTTVDGKVVATWPRAGVAGSIQPDTISYNIALSAAAASINGATDLFAIFSGMSDGKSRGRRPARDIVSYNTVIAFLDGAGRSEEAFEVFSAMKQAGIKPDKFTYTSLVNSCSKPIDMQELLYDMKEVGVKPDIVTYNTMIRTLCDRLQWYEAKKMILDMEASGIAPNAMTYSFLMTGLLKAEKYSACLSLFESACADSRTMALTENVYLYTTAISAAASLRNHEKAFHLVNRMKAAGVRPNMKTMSALMSACLSSNMTGLAVEVYKQIENPDAKAMCNGLAAMCYEGAFDDVSLVLFDQWRSRDSVMSGKQVMDVYSIMMRQVTEQGDWVAARSAFRQFLSCGFIPSKTMYQNIIEGLGLTPPRKRDLPFAKDIPLERFNFLLFVLDAIRDRNLSCDGGFYSAVLQCSSRMGGLRRKMGSLLAEARALSETTNMSKDDHARTSEIVRVGWEDLLVHYDDYKELTNVKLPHLSVNVHKNMIRQVLFAEQLVTHNGRKSLATRRTSNTQILTRSK